ncbi:MAG: hypothetical protein NC828_04525, partial [Candidatus Omnitrophica bacterium]|nr:hypothetical protein [Candidatus Omnitrophota bacterium]
SKKSIIYVNHSVVPAALEKFKVSGEGALNGGSEEWIRYVGFPSRRYKEYWERFTAETKEGTKIIDMSKGALSEADITVGVSAEHAGETQELMRVLSEEYGIPPAYKGRVVDVLNGSGDFWVMGELLEMEKEGVVPVREGLERIHKKGKEIAFNLVKKRTRKIQDGTGQLIAEAGIELDPNKPTVWLVRRLVGYKSQFPVLRDIVKVLCADRDEMIDTKWG